MSRRQLDRLADHVDEHGWDDAAKRLRNGITWTLGFSAKLRPWGPWMDYALSAGLEDRDVDPKSYLHRAENKTRSGRAKMALCRLPPGLRVLGVHLGVRNAAACAVYETMSADDVRELCTRAAVGPPGDDDMDLLLRVDSRKTYLRRIGPDRYDDVDPDTGVITERIYPAPWARLERQFSLVFAGRGGNARGRRVRKKSQPWRGSRNQSAAEHQHDGACGSTCSWRTRCGLHVWASHDTGCVQRFHLPLLRSQSAFRGGRVEQLTDEDRVDHPGSRNLGLVRAVSWANVV